MKKWLEMVVKLSYMRDIHFETVFISLFSDKKVSTLLDRVIIHVGEKLVHSLISIVCFLSIISNNYLPQVMNNRDLESKIGKMGIMIQETLMLWTKIPSGQFLARQAKLELVKTLSS